MHSVVLLKTGRTFVKVRVAAGDTIEEVMDSLQLMMSQIPVRLVRAERVVIVSQFTESGLSCPFCSRCLARRASAAGLVEVVHTSQ